RPPFIAHPFSVPLTATIPLSAAPPVVANVTAPPVFTGEPAWLGERRRAAWQEFTTRPMPTRKDERWRFASLQNFSLDAFHRPAAPPDAARDENIHAC